MYRKYYSYNDMPRPVYNQNKQSISEKPCKDESKPTPTEPGKFFGNFENDDIILAVVIFMLLANDCDDKLLLLAIAFIFISGFDGLNL